MSSPRKIVAVITGASSGIGRATALRFAAEGASLVLISRRRQVLEELARLCERQGGKAVAFAADTTDELAMRNAARLAFERFGRIDVWVNNAAAFMFGSVEATPMQAVERLLQVNVLGYMNGARAVLPYFRDQDAGVLINVSSVLGKISQPYTSAYVASKWATTAFGECLRMELRDTNIHVSTVYPASTDTPLFEHMANYTGRAPKPLDPVYEPEQVAEAILQCAYSPQREVFIGRAPRVFVGMHNASLALFEPLMAHQVENNHFLDQPAPHSSGNLFDPSEHAAVSGGWIARGSALQRRRRVNRAGALLGALAGGLAIYLGARLRRDEYARLDSASEWARQVA